MGGRDKGLIDLAGHRIIDHVIARVGRQVDRLALNLNGDPSPYADLRLPVIPDGIPDRQGPLAGVLAGLDWAAGLQGDAACLLTVPLDTPFLPLDLVAKLQDALEGKSADVAVAAGDGRLHPVISLWSLRVRETVRSAICDAGLRRMTDMIAQLRFVSVEFGSSTPFTNVNTPEDLARAGALMPSVGQSGVCQTAFQATVR